MQRFRSMKASYIFFVFLRQETRSFIMEGMDPDPGFYLLYKTQGMYVRAAIPCSAADLLFHTFTVIDASTGSSKPFFVGHPYNERSRTRGERHPDPSFRSGFNRVILEARIESLPKIRVIILLTLIHSIQISEKSIYGTNIIISAQNFNDSPYRLICLSTVAYKVQDEDQQFPRVIKWGNFDGSYAVSTFSPPLFLS